MMNLIHVTYVTKSQFVTVVSTLIAHQRNPTTCSTCTYKVRTSCPDNISNNLYPWLN